MIKVTAYIPTRYNSGILTSAVDHCTWVAGGSTMYTAIGRFHKPDAGKLSVTEDVISVITWLIELSQFVPMKVGIDDIITELHRLGEDSVLIEDSEVNARFM